MDAPRRLEAHAHDWRGPRATHSLAVFVDGERQFRVLSYDVDAGVVTRMATDEHGNILTAGDEALTETLHGDVRVELKELARA